MGRTATSEVGLLWNVETRIGRSASKRSFTGVGLPDPINYTPPEYRSILGCKRIALDTETHDPKLKEKGPGVYRRDGHILGIAIDYDDGDRRYYPLAHSGNNNLNAPEFLRSLRRDALQFRGTLVNANLQYDLDWLGSEDIFFEESKFFDVQFAEPLLDENKLSYKLEYLGRQYLGEGKYTSTLEDHYGEDFIKYLRRIHPHYVGEYACGDVYLPLEIMDRQLPLLEEQGLMDVCNMEHELIPLLLQMRRVGVRVDVQAAYEAKQACDVEAKELLHKLYHTVGFDVDVDAASSIVKAFDKVGLSYPRTAKGAPSFQKLWLENHPHELPKLITAVRKIQKVSGTFLQNYILEGNVNGRIHCMFNPLRSDEGGTVSGRFSSSYPNLQNLPSRDGKLGPMCRKIFIPENDCDWGCVDWSQIEYRFLVHYAVAAKCRGADITASKYQDDRTTDFHKLTAELAFKERAVEMRGDAKTLNFAIVYGAGKAKVAKSLGTTEEGAAPILDEYHKMLPWLRQLSSLATSQAQKNGFVRTTLGRKRRFTLWERGYGENRVLLSEEELSGLPYSERRRFKRAGAHKALNSVLQGSAADLMKLAMLKCHKAGLFKVLYPHITVHDEMDVSKPWTQEGEEAFKEMIHIMETVMPLNVPVLASANTGANWYEAK